MFNELFRLSKHSIIYSLGAIISGFIGFLLIPLYTRYLTPADYGTLEIFVSTMIVLGIFLPLGISGGLAMAYYENKDKESRKTALSTAWLYLTIGSLCILVLLEALAGSFSSLIFSSGEYTSYFRIIFMTAFLDAGIILALLVLRVKEKSINYVAVILIKFLVNCLLYTSPSPRD